MACKTIKKINSRLNYLFSKKHFFNTRSQMALMQCIDSAAVWLCVLCALRGILILTKNWKIKFKLLRINVFEFASILIKWPIYHKMSWKKLDWLPTNDRINQCVLLISFKFVNGIGPNYLNEIFQWATESNRTLWNNYGKLKHPFRKTSDGQNSICFLEPSK